MTYEQITGAHAEDVLAAATSFLASYCGAGRVPVALVPTPAHVLRVRRALAKGPCALCVRVETFDSWTADQWELYGDGRAIVQSGERTLLMQRACVEAHDAGCCVEATPGTVALLANVAREALPLLQDVRKDGAQPDLSAAERGVFEVLERYAALLEAHALCEASQVACALSLTHPCPPPLVLVGFDELECAYQHMLTSFATQTDVVRLDDGCCAPAVIPERAPELTALLGQLFSPVVGDPVAATGAVRVLLPAGRYAAPRLVCNAACEAVVAEREAARVGGRPLLPVVVAARDPWCSFDKMADALVEAGVSVGVSARRSFADTAFGRAFLALLSYVCDDTCALSQASDFALSAFSGLSWNRACELDALWRGDRTVQRAGVLADLSAASEVAACTVAALKQRDFDAALACLEDYLRRRSDLDASFRAEQRAAVSAARTFVDTCNRMGADVLEARPLWEGIAVQANALARDVALPDTVEPDLVIQSLSEVAARSACSCSTLVLCDLDARSYPVRAAEDGALLLMEKVGLGHTVDALTEARHLFFRALSAARDSVVLERVLQTQDADASYPAVMFEELLDCYRAPHAGDVDVDRATGLPGALVAYAQCAGEEALQANLALRAQDAEAEASTWDIPAAGEVSEALRSYIVIPQHAAGDGAESELLSLSPSAIESYLECPYKWFALRRLRLSEPDAGFGPLEMGSFSHGVLKSFYEHFHAAGELKVNAHNLSAARALLGETFDRHLAFQSELKRSRNPLVPRTKFEESEAAELRKKLIGYLDREMLLLGDFTPTWFEYDFGTTEPFLYAGCNLRGSIDRIDVNEHGQAVVIDYKGSLGADYVLSSASPASQAGGAMLPHKVQALVYAQVARRVLGLDVVGAVYVSYGRDAHVAGAVDRTRIGEQTLPGLDIEACGLPGPAGDGVGTTTFAELVDAVEQRIEQAAQTLACGHIAPDPRGSDPCGYCPVLTCERRREV